MQTTLVPETANYGSMVQSQRHFGSHFSFYSSPRETYSSSSRRSLTKLEAFAMTLTHTTLVCHGAYTITNGGGGGGNKENAEKRTSVRVPEFAAYILYIYMQQRLSYCPLVSFLFQFTTFETTSLIRLTPASYIANKRSFTLSTLLHWK